MYLALWLIRRWRLPATPCFTLPVAVSLKRFLTPLLVFSLGILSPLPPRGADVVNSRGSPFGRAVRFFQSWKEGAPIWGGRKKGKLSGGLIPPLRLGVL